MISSVKIKYDSVIICQCFEMTEIHEECPVSIFLDIDTRRRAACDLVRALSKSFEGPVIQNFSGYVQAMLQVSHLFQTS